MIIELGKASVATKAVMPNGLVLDPTPLVAPKIHQTGRTL